MSDSTTSDTLTTVLEMYQAGVSVEDIHAKTGMAPRTIQRHTSAAGIHRKPPGGTKPVKRDRNLSRVLELHREGKNVYEISKSLSETVHYRTIGIWLTEAGERPLYPPEFNALDKARRGKPGRPPHPRRDEAIQRCQAGESVESVAADIGVNKSSVYAWTRSVMGTRSERAHSPERQQRAVELHRQGMGLDAIRIEMGTDYYIVCELLEAAGINPLQGNTCPCGKNTQSKARQYCSKPCRLEYGQKRQADPENYFTFTCENPACGKSVTRRKSYAKGSKKFCGNACAQKVTKRVKHYVVRDCDMVLDSGWEMLFAGLCMFRKVAVERVDRESIVERAPGRHYAPDFMLTALDPPLWVEVKGLEDPEDRERWDAWRLHRGWLAVVDHEVMEMLLAGGDDLEARLIEVARVQEQAGNLSYNAGPSPRLLLRERKPAAE